jgi:shikimate kinase
LTGQGGLAEIRELLAVRTPIYEACAHVTIDADGRTPSEIVRDILASLPADATPE